MGGGGRGPIGARPAAGAATVDWSSAVRGDARAAGCPDSWEIRPRWAHGEREDVLVKVCMPTSQMDRDKPGICRPPLRDRRGDAPANGAV